MVVGSEVKVGELVAHVINDGEAAVVRVTGFSGVHLKCLCASACTNLLDTGQRD